MSETTKLKTADGSIVYYWENKMHNWDGPAYIPQGNKRAAEYWLFGIQLSKLEWEERHKDVNGVPFYKTSAGRASGTRV